MQAEIKIAGRNLNNLRYRDDMAESKEEFNSLLMKVKEGSEKAGLKLSSQKPKIMASSPITSQQIRKQCKQWGILFSWARKSLQMVTAALEEKLWPT